MSTAAQALRGSAEALGRAQLDVFELVGLVNAMVDQNDRATRLEQFMMISEALERMSGQFREAGEFIMLAANACET